MTESNRAASRWRAIRSRTSTVHSAQLGRRTRPPPARSWRRRGRARARDLRCDAWGRRHWHQRGRPRSGSAGCVTVATQDRRRRPPSRAPSGEGGTTARPEMLGIHRSAITAAGGEQSAISAPVAGSAASSTTKPCARRRRATTSRVEITESTRMIRRPSRVTARVNGPSSRFLSERDGPGEMRGAVVIPAARVSVKTRWGAPSTRAQICAARPDGTGEMRRAATRRTRAAHPSAQARLRRESVRFAVQDEERLGEGHAQHAP